MTVSTGPVADPADAYEIDRACFAHDRPDVPGSTLEEFTAALSVPHAGYRSEHHLGHLDGVPVGYLELSFPLRDNLDNAEIRLAVHPAHRRRGVGRALFALAERRLRAEGRKRLLGAASRRHPDGPAFAAEVGALAALEEIRSTLRLSESDDARLAALLADAWTHADGYRLVLWTGVPPDEIIDDVAALDSRFMLDAPTGDLAFEAEAVDADRIREGERARQSRGRISYHAGALHGDRLIAWTQLNGSRSHPDHAWQGITLVDPDHRGHRLGLLIKLANLAQIRELHAGLERVSTFNAATNQHMLAINRQMGFREVESVLHFQWTA